MSLVCCIDAWVVLAVFADRFCVAPYDRFFISKITEALHCMKGLCNSSYLVIFAPSGISMR
nr:MAG TPA: hypothetical protein [Caudoviricetes sp.]